MILVAYIVVACPVDVRSSKSVGPTYRSRASGMCWGNTLDSLTCSSFTSFFLVGTAFSEILFYYCQPFCDPIFSYITPNGEHQSKP